MPLFAMSKFTDLIGAVDAVVMDEFGDPYRWTKSNATTADITGILDLDAQFLGPNDDVAYQGKTVTVQVSAMPTYNHGETIQALDADGNLTGPVYKLQQLVENDGAMKVIEVTS